MEPKDELRLRFIQVVDKIVADRVDGIRYIKEVCERLDMHRQTYVAIQSLTRYPSIDYLLSLCTIFHANPTFLLLGKGPIFYTEDNVTTQVDAQALQLHRVEEKLDNLTKMLTKATT